MNARSGHGARRGRSHRIRPTAEVSLVSGLAPTPWGILKDVVTRAVLAATTSASGEEISISECSATFQFERTIVGDRGFHVCRFDVWNRDFRAPFDRSDHRAATAGLVDLRRSRLEPSLEFRWIYKQIPHASWGISVSISAHSCRLSSRRAESPAGSAPLCALP